MPFDTKQVDAVVLSHSHLDHAGKLPSLCKTYDGPIHCTSATKDLCGIMLLDSAHIQEQDAIFVSKVRARKHQPPVEPLYTTPDAQKCVQQLVAHDYEKTFSPVAGVNVTFRDAGHILGSAQVILDIQENGRKFRWLFTGDIGRGGDELLRDPIPVENVDYLQIESTYAARVHEQRPDADDLVGKLVGETLKQKGKIIIPAFSVGRTQQIVYVLHELTCAGKLPRVPIFVDSPLSVNATDIYKKHPESLRADDLRHDVQQRKSVRHGKSHLHHQRRGIQKAERTQGGDDHHQRVRHVRRRTHPASPEKQHRALRTI